MRFTNLRRVRQLGTGSEGTTSLQKDRNTGEYYACKDRRLRTLGDGVRPREVWIREDCMPRYHRNLLDFHGWQLTETFLERRCNVYYEYCAGGDLKRLIPRGHPAAHAEKFIWHVFIQVAEALHAMHNCGPEHVVHRDVKPANIFLTSQIRPNHDYPTIKLGDYGISVTEPTSDASGHMAYMGQEIESSAKAGIWALGASIHALCHGFSPVLRNGPNCKRDPHARRPQDLPSRYYNELHWRVMSCLQADPKDRPDSEALVRKLYRDRPSEHS